ncbi:hypothetical protein GCM10010909_07780 [Acidocella aquatica]|uniref:Hedgehog/Intein (Hint) domain-containing protein n=1 Tax=Acidocella aquatica TaxID=1922313 RepID=A0ABQ6A0Y4_9PROT|nr:Hint domain-containing protein [Acidocella aquatica]GLR66100.1 hypothetical protein GCM10010909_07780 [Acidocella aquatica]
MSQTITGYHNVTQTLSAGTPNVTITGTINAYGPAGTYSVNVGNGPTLIPFAGAVFGPSTGNFTITNTGLIETHGTNASNPFAGGILLGASGAVLNSGTIQGASGIAVFGTGSSYIENSKQIDGSIGVGVVLFSGSGTVVNSGTIYGARYGAVALFGGGVVSNTSTGLLSSGTLKGDQYAVTGQKNSHPVTVQNAGTIIGYSGGINLGSGGLVSNSGDIRAVGTNTAGTGNKYTNFYGGVQLNDGGTLINSGTITGQNGVYLHYYNPTTHSNTPPPGLAGYVKNSGLIAASSTAGLQIRTTSSTYGLFGTGIALELPGTAVNNGMISASNVGVFIQAQGTNAETMTVVNNGTITGVRYAGIEAQNGTAIIHNSGTIQQTGSGGGTLAAYAGVYLQQSGQVFNSLSSVISGRSGIRMNSSGYVDNAGSIAGNHGAGVYFANAGTMVNTGTVTGVHEGIVTGATGAGAGEISNTGLITAGNTIFINNGVTLGDTGMALLSGGHATNQSGGTISAGIGVYLRDAGEIINQAGGRIIGGTYLGVYAANTLGLTAGLNNNGYIYGKQIGAYFKDGGNVSNASGGTITGGRIGVDVTASSGILATIDNAGQLTATGTTFVFNGKTYDATGVVLSGGGTFDNAATGTVSGVGGAALLGSNGTLINAGLIQGAPGGSAVYFGGTGDRLILDTGARFTGSIGDAANNGVLELASGSSAGSFDMGGTVSGFNSITFDNGAAWTLEGNYAELGSIAAAINGFTIGDTLVLDGFTATSDTFAGGVLTLSNGTSTELLSLPGVPPATAFTITDVTAGTQITEVTCYARGTRIATARGEVAVEELQIGDEVQTLHAGLQKIKWIGTRSYAAPFANHAKVLPIHIKPGALAENIPARDLFVSPGHAICIDGALVHAARLVNGVSITQLPRVEEVTYFHIELENHEIIFAENCPAETFMGESFRPQFHNAESFHTLYPQGSAPEHMCLPRLDSGFQLEAIRHRLKGRAGIASPSASGPLRGYVDSAGPQICAGWAQDTASPETPVCLDIFSAGQRVGRVLANFYREDVRDAGFGSGNHGFEFTLPEGIVTPVEVRRSTDSSLLAQTDAAANAAAA